MDFENQRETRFGENTKDSALERLKLLSQRQDRFSPVSLASQGFINATSIPSSYAVLAPGIWRRAELSGSPRDSRAIRRMQCWCQPPRRRPLLNLQGVEAVDRSILTLPDKDLQHLLYSCSAAFHTTKMRPDAKPGDVPSCMMFDEMYAHDRGWGTLGILPRSAPEVKPKRGEKTQPSVPAGTPWGVVHLAYSDAASFGANQSRKLRADPRTEQDASQQNDGNDPPRLSNLTRRKSKALKELPMGERPLGLLESSAINVGTAVATEEERQQNVAAMEMFQPEWSCLGQTKPPPRADLLHLGGRPLGSSPVILEKTLNLNEVFCNAGARAWSSGRRSQPLDFNESVFRQNSQQKHYHSAIGDKLVKAAEKVAKQDRASSLRDCMQALRSGVPIVKARSETYPYPYGKEVYHSIPSQAVNLRYTELDAGQQAEPKRPKPVFTNAPFHSMAYSELPDATSNAEDESDPVTRDSSGKVLFSLLPIAASARANRNYKISFPSYAQVRSPDKYCQPFPLQKNLRRPPPSLQTDKLDSSVLEPPGGSAEAILEFKETSNTLVHKRFRLSTWAS